MWKGVNTNFFCLVAETLPFKLFFSYQKARAFKISSLTAAERRQSSEQLKELEQALYRMLFGWDQTLDSNMAQIHARAQKNINRPGYRNALDGGWLESLTFGWWPTERLGASSSSAWPETKQWCKLSWSAHQCEKLNQQERVERTWDLGEDTLQNHVCSCRGFHQDGRMNIVRITST